MKSILVVILALISCSLGWTSKEFETEENFRASHVIRPSEDTAVWGIKEDQLNELFEHSSNLVCLVYPEYFSTLNKAWTKLLGWSEQDLLSKPYIKFVHPDDVALTNNVATKITQTSLVHGSPVDPTEKLDTPLLINFENRYRAKGGACYLLQWLALSQVSGPTSYPPMLFIGKNITHQKEAEQQTLALKQAEISTKMKSTFVTHMSHELRTPLNGILGFIELALEEEGVSPKVQTYLTYAHDSAHLLLSIANDIIDVSQIEAGALKIDKRPFHLLNAFQSVFTILNLQAEKKQLTLTSSLSPELPLMLQGDESRLKQILFNLGTNSIKFTSKGKVSLKIDGTPDPHEPHLFLLRGRVKDTGIGMNPAFVKTLFQSFSQENRSMNRQCDGAGLGLYITKQLCEKMGGSVHVISTPGLGSTFQFQLRLELYDPSSLSLVNLE